MKPLHILLIVGAILLWAAWPKPKVKLVGDAARIWDPDAPPPPGDIADAMFS
jgi:hypothetical protein